MQASTWLRSSRSRSCELRNTVAKVTSNRHIHQREARTAKKLAVVVACFITCWLPFFVAYIITPFLEEPLQPGLYKFFVWLGTL